MTEKIIHETTQEKHIETRQDTLHLVAEILKNKRFDCSISMRDVEKELNIRIQYLQALESGDWSAMPGEVYALGFLRQYAKYLKCDVTVFIEKLKSNDYTLSKPVTFPDPAISPSRKWMIISLVALVVLFIVFNVLRQQTSSPLPSEIMQKTAHNITEKESDNTIPEQPKIPQPTAQQGNEEETAGSINIVNNRVDKDLTEKPVIKTRKDKETPHAAKQAPKALQTGLSTQLTPKKTDLMQHTYLFTARSDDVWLQVYQQGKEGKPLREALLKQGESLKLTSKKILSVTCGKPQALEISMDGKVVVTVGSMSKKKHVVRHFILPRPTAQ
ncbi:MAG: DUF4115 domain-containing protein [Mariprofundaceae bacterium]|nr:DUF4115 domain-containing protein [Mariprofundaceae bacterium]